MPQASFQTPVNASTATIWELLLDRAEHPEKYSPAKAGHAKVRTTSDKTAGTVTSQLDNHPVYEGTIVTKLSPGNTESCGLPILTMSVDVKPRSPELEQKQEAAPLKGLAQPDAIKAATMYLKHVIEVEDAVRESKGNKNFETVRRMFLGGESMDVRNFAAFYTDDAYYQFGNFPVARGPQGIISSSDGFIANCRNCYHHIKNMWEVGKDTVAVEMDVSYVHFNGKQVRLPVADTIKLKGDKVQELRIYMDISPLFAAAEQK